jgi:hypothetical protein
MLRLRALNLLRWLKEYALVWTLLSVIYAITVTLALQPILERVFGQALPFTPLLLALCTVLLIPGVFEALPLPAVPIPAGRLIMGAPLTRLYQRHELRRGTTWLVVAVSAVAGAALPAAWLPLWILIAQLPAQRALYSVGRWLALARAHDPRQGSVRLLDAIWIAQTVQFVKGWIVFGLLARPPLSHWLALGAGGLGGALSSSMMALEGDSGRPYLVNFLALAAGTMGGYLCFYSPWFLLLVAYAAVQLRGLAVNRSRSVEHLDEDAQIS